MAIVTLRYWAAAKEAAGTAEQTVTAQTLADALVLARGTGAPGRLQAVLARSSFLINGSPVGRRAAESVQLAEGAVIEVLPPFAGG